MNSQQGVYSSRTTASPICAHAMAPHLIMHVHTSVHGGVPPVGRLCMIMITRTNHPINILVRAPPGRTIEAAALPINACQAYCKGYGGGMCNIARTVNVYTVGDL